MEFSVNETQFLMAPKIQENPRNLKLRPTDGKEEGLTKLPLSIQPGSKREAYHCLIKTLSGKLIGAA